jgi:hypothetical protein
VVVEDVAILEQAVRPAPDDVEVLRLVRVDAPAEGVQRAEGQDRGEGEGERALLGGSPGGGRERVRGKAQDGGVAVRS